MPFALLVVGDEPDRPRQRARTVRHLTGPMGPACLPGEPRPDVARWPPGPTPLRPWNAASVRYAPDSCLPPWRMTCAHECGSHHSERCCGMPASSARTSVSR
jgi:hypothetical protein